jgi:hypothetical protein
MIFLHFFLEGSSARLVVGLELAWRVLNQTLFPIQLNLSFSELSASETRANTYFKQRASENEVVMRILVLVFMIMHFSLCSKLTFFLVFIYFRPKLSY